MAAKTYYGILVVLQRCSQSEIRRAYRRLSLLLHPDKNRGREKIAERKFKEMRNSYETLSDPITRVMYDDALPSKYSEDDDEDEDEEFDEGEKEGENEGDAEGIDADADEDYERECERIRQRNKGCLWQRSEPTGVYPERVPYSPEEHHLA